MSAITGQSNSAAHVSGTSEKSSSSYRGPSIDHTVLSPSGRVSRAARNAALNREASRLFPPGFWDQPPKTDAQKAQDKAASLLRSAANLRQLASSGMSVKKFTRAAERLEAEAAALVTA